MTLLPNRWITTLGCLLITLVGLQFAQASPVTAGSPNPELPDIGTPADAVLTNSEEYQVGSMIMRQLRDGGELVDDPVLNQYIQDIGSKLAAHAQEGNRVFHFYMVRDGSINAFALPGGFICVNAGLLLATRSESELAGVLAHEISHVTQRHAVRGVLNQRRASLASTAALLAAILIGATSGNPDAAMAGMVVGQGTAAQQQLNFSREDEFEADRIGINVLASAGFDPNAMASFFDVLARHEGGYGENAHIIELLQTHPLSTERVAEAKSRSAKFPTVRAVDTMAYRLARERLRVMQLPIGSDPVEVYPEIEFKDPLVNDIRHYGRALAFLREHQPEQAVAMLHTLVERHPDVIEYQVDLGQAYLDNHQFAESRALLKHARDLFPRNPPVTIRYAESLMRDNDPTLAHAVLLDLFNNVPPSPSEVRFIALAASAAGESAEANYYMAEYHLMNGELSIAIETLRQALAAPSLTPVQRARYKARIEELREYLPARSQAALDRGEPLPPEAPDRGR